MNLIQAPQFEVTGVLVEKSPTGRTEYTMIEKNTEIVVEFDMSNSKSRSKDDVRQMAEKVFYGIVEANRQQQLREDATVKVGDVI